MIVTELVAIIARLKAVLPEMKESELISLAAKVQNSKHLKELTEYLKRKG